VQKLRKGRIGHGRAITMSVRQGEEKHSIATREKEKERERERSKRITFGKYEAYLGKKPKAWA
jgi:hypothetical protein